MTQQNKPEQAGEEKAAVNKDEATKDQKPRELSIEELGKVAGGRIDASLWGLGTNSLKWVPPIGTNTSFGKK